MQNPVNDLLILLATDPEKRRQFELDPKAFLQATSLNEADRYLFLNRDAGGLRLATFRRAEGQLFIVGTGIQLAAHLTPEAENCIRTADRVLHACAEGAAAQWVESLNPKSESLDLLIRYDQPRLVSYHATVERILACVRHGYRVCVVFYGHPGFFANATHEALKRARGEGFETVMLPAVSAEDCLFADLGIDPGTAGYQSLEATDFLIHRKRISIRNSVVLWQIGMIGEAGYRESPNRTGLNLLIRTLLQIYPAQHPVIVYEASQYPITVPSIQKIVLQELSDAKISAYSTLYIPPAEPSQRNPEMLQRLGL